jgi:hypothetical protein
MEFFWAEIVPVKQEAVEDAYSQEVEGRLIWKKSDGRGSKA